jgi:hypothetical protein
VTVHSCARYLRRQSTPFTSIFLEIGEVILYLIKRRLYIVDGGLNIGRAAPALFGELSCRGDLPLPQSELPAFSLYGDCSRILRIEEQCPQRPTEFAFAEEGRLLVWSQ